MAERFSLYLHSSIHPDWKPFFGGKATRFEGILDILASKMDQAPICPDISAIFEAFRLSPKGVKMVIIGQDPYHTPGTADGLAFSSSNQRNSPPSLKRIFEAIDSSHPGVFNLSSCSLKLWMYSGVFLINTALTTEEGKPGAHFDIWKEFTRNLISYLSSLPDPIGFVLWGNKAAEFEKQVDARHWISKYHHPSPLTGKSFRECPLFRDVSGFDWSTSHEWRVWTDGSGLASQWGTWAVVFNHAGIGSFGGEVQKYKYVLGETKIEVDTSYPKEATAQRGELLAIAYSLFIFLILHPATGSLTIISDSKNSVGTVNEWYDSRKKEGKEGKMENIDIIEIIMQIIGCIRSLHGTEVNIVHISAHQTGDDPDILGNREADRIAGSPLIKKGASIWRSNPNVWVNL